MIFNTPRVQSAGRVFYTIRNFNKSATYAMLEFFQTSAKVRAASCRFLLHLCTHRIHAGLQRKRPSAESIFPVFLSKEFFPDSCIRFFLHMMNCETGKKPIRRSAGKTYLRRIYAGIPSIKERGELRSSRCSCAGTCWFCAGISGIAA